MDELDMVRSLGGDTPDPDQAAKQAARAALMTRASTSPRRLWWTTRMPRITPSRVLGLAASLGLVAILVSGVVPVGPGPHDAAAAALDRVAGVALTTADDGAARTGYRHTVSDGANVVGVSTNKEGTHSVWALVPVHREIWVKPDGSGRLIERRSKAVWFSAADKAAWVAAGSPELGDDRTTDTRFDPTPPGSDPGTPQLAPGSLGYADVDGLPTDVDGLETLIRSRAAANGGGATDAEVFTIVGGLLSETVAAPKLRAALYRIVARLDGVELMGTATDHAGRSGTGVSLVDDDPSPGGRGRERHVLIFDPDTSRLLEKETVQLSRIEGISAEPPVTIGYTTYLTSEIVSHMP
jgi:hypothetical protein